MFKARQVYERNLSKEDLIALDHSLASLLTPKNVKEAVKKFSFWNEFLTITYKKVVQALNKELEGLNLAYEMRNLTESKREAEKTAFLRDKFPDDVPEDQRIKNFNALERYHAYAIALKSRIEDGLAKNLSDKEIQFEKKYLKKLRQAALEDPEEAEYLRKLEKQKEKRRGGRAAAKEQDKSTIQEYQSAAENSLKDELKMSLRSIVRESEAKNRVFPLKEEIKEMLRRTELVKLSTK